jgi:putative Mn2+ efflux pump MntP
MTLLTLLALGFGLSVDSFAAAVARGSSARVLRRRDAVLVGLVFGVAQAVTPLIGWLLGRALSGWVEAVDHWIAFGLLAFIGGQMVVRASIELRAAPTAEGEQTGGHHGLRLGGVAVTALATSIDAIAVGIGLAMTEVNIWAACLVIGVVTTLMAALGMMIGKRAGESLGPWAELFGGLILVVLGATILGEHLAAVT